MVRGRKYITPAVAELLADGLGANLEKPPHEQLSEREFQVFLRLAKGETVGAIADRSRGKADFGVPFLSLVQLDFPAYEQS